MVLGYESCGAIKGAIDNVELGNLTETLSELKQAVEMSQDFNGEKNSKNPSFVDYFCKNNVSATINEIRTQSPILKEMEDKGEIKIVGGVNDLSDGKINLLTL